MRPQKTITAKAVSKMEDCDIQKQTSCAERLATTEANLESALNRIDILERQVEQLMSDLREHELDHIRLP